MNTRIAVPFFVVLFCATTLLHAQEKIDPAFDLIDPFLKENTFLVVHVDLKSLDVDAIVAKVKPQMMEGTESAIRFGAKFQGKENDEDFLAQARKQAEAAIDAQIAMVKSTVRSILDAGVEGVFFLSMMETVQTLPVIMAIPGEPTFDSQVTELIRSMGFAKAGFADDMTFYALSPDPNMVAMMTGGAVPLANLETASTAPKVSPESFMTTLRKTKKKYRTEINDALYLQRKSPIRVVFAPSVGMKGWAQMAAPAMLAGLPEGLQVDQKDILAIVKDFVNLSVGIDPVTARFNIAAQFPSEESAENAGKFFAGLAAGVEDETTRTLVHEFLPKLNKNRLILVLKEEHFEKLAAVGPMLTGPGGMGEISVEVEENENTESSDSME